MAHELIEQDPFFEIHLSGSVSPWDIVTLIHQLHKKDPNKSVPDLWSLDPNLDFSMYTFPIIIQTIFKLISLVAKGGCRSAILAPDEFMQIKVDTYCADANTVLPFEVKGFSDRDEALAWLLDDARTV